MNFLLLIVVMIDFTTAIICNFKFIEYNQNSIENKSFNFIESHASESLSAPKLEPFECDEVETGRDYSNTRHKSVSHKFGFRFGFEDDDEYESVEVCEKISRNIRPAALNNINNQLKSVVNTETFSQTILTEECTSINQSCADSSSLGSSFCKQVFVRTKLQAFRADGVIYEEYFYFPSNCVCQQRKAQLQNSTFNTI